MKSNQLNQGKMERVMYVENKDGEIDGSKARIGWVKFSKTGKSVFYRGRELLRNGGAGISGNFVDVSSGEEYWVSGIKKRGSNTHWAEKTEVEIDEDARDEYVKLKNDSSV